nr:amidase family protein [Thermus amyloliquefaciens]
MDLLTAKTLLERGKTTPLLLLEEALERAQAFQDRNALAYLDAEGARQEAERLTKELKQGTVRGPLHGLPLTVKDLFPAKGMPTRAGTRAPSPPCPRRPGRCAALRRREPSFSPRPTCTRWPWASPGKTPGRAPYGTP